MKSFFRNSFWRASAFVALAIVLLAAGATWALAQTDGVINACVLKDGTIRIVTDISQCKKVETPLSWNIVGPKGEPGQACWDLNGNGVGDIAEESTEDFNGDGVVDVLDCKGPQGEQGVPGEDGPQGEAGPSGPSGVVPTRQLLPAANSYSTIDTTYDLEYSYSITIGIDGLPVVSYYDMMNTALKVAHCDDQACSTSTLTSLDNAGSNSGFPTIAIGADGMPIMSYHNGDVDDLKVAHCNDIKCESATITVIDDGNIALWSEITIGSDGLPIIVFKTLPTDSEPEYVKVAHCEDLACSTSTIYSLVELGQRGGAPSIAVGSDGFPVIVYSYNGLNLIHCNSFDCASHSISTIDPDGGGGRIIIGVDGLPLIWYGSSGGWKFAHCNDVTCSNASFNLIDMQSSGIGTITIGADGMPIIAYHPFTRPGMNLRVARCTDAYCSGVVINTLDPGFVYGGSPSITIGTDGLPIVAYSEYLGDETIGTQGMQVVHCSNTFCSPFFRRR